ncbi:MAG: hypothetical protein K9H64_04670 [Bacteroidales bacterium]|nr:hypothetical protein [Bacteroidales bacterium]MCF8455103.1 hypothetical protein [Bacteroidales bacterium]
MKIVNKSSNMGYFDPYKKFISRKHGYTRGFGPRRKIHKITNPSTFVDRDYAFNPLLK